MSVPAAPRLQTVTPILPVGDLAAAIAFYRDVLGFQVAWQWGMPPTIASVCRDTVELMLEVHGPDEHAGAAKLYVAMSGVDAWYEAATRAGAKVLVPLAPREYGMKDCRIADPDGNELSFGEHVPG